MPHRAVPLSTESALGRRAQAALQALKAQDRWRSLCPQQRGLIDLSHNDYLGLRDDQAHQSTLRAAIQDLPCGAGASRLLGGEHPIFAELENAFAAFKGAEASLYFPSGYAANESVITTLARLPGTAFFSDALNHASLIDGFRLAALPTPRKSIYRHADMEDLEKHLRQSVAEINIIVTETVFSMDGDCAPLQDLEGLARRYRGVLVLDEAHAIFVWGTQGRGLAPQCTDIDILTIDTAGKALGVQGALLSGPRWLRELLINQARPFIYTTAASPWLAAALLATLRASTTFQARRERLAQLSQQVLGALKAQGWDTGPSSTQIIPILLGADARALAKSQTLRVRNLLVPAIRPPTVAEGSARLRLSLHSQLTDPQITELIEAFA